MSQGFSDAAIRAYEPSIRAHADKLCLNLEQNDKDNEAGFFGPAAVASERWSSAKNMSQWCRCFIFYTIATHPIEDVPLTKATGRRRR